MFKLMGKKIFEILRKFNVLIWIFEILASLRRLEDGYHCYLFETPEKGYFVIQPCNHQLSKCVIHVIKFGDIDVM